ncbi:MAG: glycosyltransferase family 2 protein [Patescibacteria group bacterium]|jgi:glycosyltransferase involved in cell wall biosynthesis
MKFSIITPTHQRPKELERAINSILGQDYNNFEFIIVNDSPDFDYSELENMEILKDRRIKYFKNEKNMGVNFSRNFALDNVSEDSDYIIFLDDDDWLNEKCLSEAVKAIKENPNYNWYVSNRADFRSNKSITKNNTKKVEINYLVDYLIKKRFYGDATHCIDFKKNKKTRFPVNIGKHLDEAWYYYIQIDNKFYYYDFNSTFSYGSGDMTIYSKRNKKERLSNSKILFKDSIINKRLNFKLLLYFVLRYFAIVLK